MEERKAIQPTPPEASKKKIEPPSPPANGSYAKILAIGVGGGGNNAINNMVESGIKNIDFLAVNTDCQALDNALTDHKLQIGKKITNGLGAGGDPEIGRRAAEESRDEVSKIITGYHMVFITAGMGGGTGTGASPIIADIAKKSGALTIGVVTLPFNFEGRPRSLVADEGIERLKNAVDTLIVIQNDRLLKIADERVSFLDAFGMADDVLRQAIHGINEVISTIGLINVDFADVRAVMSEGGSALMSIGEATGDDRARKAAQMALTNELLDITINGANGILFNVTAGPDVTMKEVDQAAEIIRETADPNAKIYMGMVIDPAMKEKVRITLIATGFGTIRSSRPLVSRSEALGSKRPVNQPPPGTGPLTGAGTKPVPPIQRVGSPGDEDDSAARDNLEVPAFLRRYKGDGKD